MSVARLLSNCCECTSAVESACCCGCSWNPKWMTDHDPDFMKKLLGTDPSVPKFTQVSASYSVSFYANRPNKTYSTSGGGQLPLAPGGYQDLRWYSDTSDGEVELIVWIFDYTCLYISLIQYITTQFSAISMGDCEPHPPDEELGLCDFSVGGFPLSINGANVPTMVDTCDDGYFQSAQIDITFS